MKDNEFNQVQLLCAAMLRDFFDSEMQSIEQTFDYMVDKILETITITLGEDHQETFDSIKVVVAECLVLLLKNKTIKKIS